MWRVSVLLARIGGALLVATALLVSVEVLLRKAGIVAFSVGSELSSYALAIAATWSFALVLLLRGHVRIDIVSESLPDGPRAFVNLLAVASLAAVGAVLSWSAFETVATSLRLGTVSTTTLAVPLWIPQGLSAGGPPLVHLHRGGADARSGGGGRAAGFRHRGAPRRPGERRRRSGCRRHRGAAPVRGGAGTAMIPTAISLLFVLLAISLPVGAALVVVAFGLDVFFTPISALQGDGRVELGLLVQRAPRQRAAVHPAGRDPLALGYRGSALQFHEPVALLAAGRADARQHRRQHGLRGDVRLQRRHGRDHLRRRRPGGRPLQIRRAAVLRLGRRGRNARHSHSAVHQPHHLRLADGNVGAEPLPRRVPARLGAQPFVLGHHRSHLPSAAAHGRHAGGGHLGGADCGPAGAITALRDLRGGGGEHLCRGRDADRVGLARRRHRALSRRRASQTELAHDDRGAGRDHARAPA